MTRTAKAWIAVVLTGYIAAVLLVVLWPVPVDSRLDNLLFRVLNRLYEFGMPTTIDYFFVESAANVVMFVPLGVLITLLLPLRRWWWSVLGLAVLSACIEVFQGLFLPSRYAMFQDVVANSAGGLMGALLGLVILWRVQRRRAVWSALPAAPTSAERPVTVRYE